MTVDVAAAAQLACLLEVSAPKPGNVSPGRHFSDTRYEHFLASAAAIGGPLAAAGQRPLGATIRAAVESTSQWASSNTNLGIVLLLAPLAKAAHALGSRAPGLPSASPGLRDAASTGLRDAAGLGSRAPGLPSASPGLRGAAGPGLRDAASPALRDEVREVLQATTVADARDAYAAIRIAAPGGLGRADDQDVARDPEVTLLEAMRLAADRDDIAYEYASGFEITFTCGTPALEAARRDGLPWDDAVVETFLTLAGRRADTHIVRRGGAALAADVAERARAVLAAGGVRSEAGRRALTDWDARLRQHGNLANPGTSADLTAAAIFVVLLGGGWNLAADGAGVRRRTPHSVGGIDGAR